MAAVDIGGATQQENAAGTGILSVTGKRHRREWKLELA
jgi:hypothetical protein